MLSPISQTTPTTIVPIQQVSAAPMLPLRRVAARQRLEPRHQYLLTEDLFTAALEREFKRVDRFDEAFALLVISRHDAHGEAPWTDVVHALTNTKSDTDIIGWLEHGVAIGLMRPLVHLEPIEAAAALSGAVQRQLTRMLTRETAASCSIRLEVHSHRSHTAPVSTRKKAAGQKMSDALANGSKRALDVTGSMGLLILLAPVFLVVSTLIKLTSNGPVFFRQLRIGQHGRPFTMLKFRTMKVNADERIHQQYVTQFIQSGAAAAGPDKVFKIVDDPRVTPVGRFLRRSSLDEIPQFLNVLQGDMALVGPRPPLPYEVSRYKRWHHRRLSEAKPGITGLWQVTGRSRTSFDEMVRLDLRYAKRYSLWTDIKILLATPRAVVSGKGAH